MPDSGPDGASVAAVTLPPLATGGGAATFGVADASFRLLDVSSNADQWGIAITTGGGEQFTLQHYAFLVSEEEFDVIYGRIRQGAIQHWADPGRSHAGEINRHDGGRGVYFASNDDHLLEIITRPYGG